MHACRLSRARLGDEGATALAVALQRNRLLRRLVVDGNHIGEFGAGMLGQALEVNSTLEELM